MKNSEKYNFCTLFDSYYLTRGIALYQSLETCCDDFHLYIFTMDEQSQIILEKLNLENATIIPLSDFENEDLLRVKPTRTIAEYCWTCTASTIWYSINNFKLEHCTYLDVDMRFFSSPEPIFEEIGTRSVGITPHNFTSNLKPSEIYGKYCVQFVYFKNDNAGLAVLNWWRKSCIEWCYARMEDGKYGDQKYLDYFQDKFDNVHEITHIGAGVAPWNIYRYKIKKPVGKQIMIALKTDHAKEYSLIFYHYQGLKFKEKGSNIIAEASFLKIPAWGLKHIYEPYVNQLTNIKNKIKGTPDCIKNIIFRRKLKKAVGIFFKLQLKRFLIVQKFYYYLQRKRYSRPDKIGGTL
jgi:hypothetical protein